MGELKLFLGYTSGVGKTYAMLDEARERLRANQEVILGDLDIQHDQELIDMSQLFYRLPKTMVHQMSCFDVDKAVARKPDLLLLENLGYLNPEGLHFKTRLEDVAYLLESGIDVYATLDIGDILGYQELLRPILHHSVRYPIDDRVFELASSVRLIDMDPQDLIARYHIKHIQAPLHTKQELSFLRELALQKTTEHVQLKHYFKLEEASVLYVFTPEKESLDLIRWTARYAGACRMGWKVLYVAESEDQLEDAQRDVIDQAGALTQSLGGQFEILHAKAIVGVLAQYAVRNHVSDLVIDAYFFDAYGIGLSRYLPWELWKSRFGSINVHTMNTGSLQLRRKRRHRSQRTSWQDILKLVAVLVLTTLTGLLFRQLKIGEANIMLVYLLGIILLARHTYGYRYGIIASLVAMLLFSYFFIEPYNTLYSTFTHYPLVFVVMIALTIVISTMTMSHKKQTLLAMRSEERSTLLYQINQDLLKLSAQGEIVSYVAGLVSTAFNASVILFTEDYPHGYLHLLNERDQRTFQADLDQDILATIYQTQQKLSHDASGNASIKGYYVPLTSNQHVIAVIGLVLEHPLDLESEGFLNTILSQVVIVFQRQQLMMKQQRLQMDQEREKLRNQLLRAISHDLRTPLTTILGSSSTLLEHLDAISHDQQRKLLENIHSDANWLLRMVENVLLITKMQAESFQLHPVLEYMDEVLAQVYQRIHQHFPTRKVEFQSSEGVDQIPMDAMLIQQVFINLIENAIKHSPEDSLIHVRVKALDDQVECLVDDQGEGLSQAQLETVFDQNKSMQLSDMSRGLGIGLTLCASIIKAHGGKMWALNHRDKGAQFGFTLPMKEIGYESAHPLD